MRALGFGVLAALVVAGPSLYPLVEGGSMSTETALFRGGIVALACAVGFAFVSSISAMFRETRIAEDDQKDDAEPGHPTG